MYSRLFTALLALSVPAQAVPANRAGLKARADSDSDPGAVPNGGSGGDNGGSSMSAAPTTTVPESQGNIPYSLTESFEPATATSQQLNPSPTLNGSAAVESLWSMVEAKIPVETAAITTVRKVPSNWSLGEDPPPYEPEFLSSDAANLTFPKGFLYGSASAATQIEGATKADGKGPSVWDWRCHLYPDQCTGFTSDITDNQYYQYSEDFNIMKALGFNVYAFSFAWTRIYPLGNGKVNEAGLQHYDEFINAMIDKGIEPVGTLFHWDTPMNLMLEYGSFADTGDRLVKDFVTYAETMFRRFGNKITKWVTFNEPNVFCGQVGALPYNTTYPEGINSTTAVYRCSYNLLRAHAHAYHRYHQLANEGTIKKGEIALKNDDNWPVPYREGNEDDLEAARRHAEFKIGIYSEPTYGSGDWPQVVKDTLGDIIPTLTAEDQKLIKSTGDVYYIDAYRTDVSRAAFNGIQNCASNMSDPNWPVCDETEVQYAHALATSWPLGSPADPDVNWLYNTARLLRRQLKYLTSKYPSKGGIFVSEFGFNEPKENEREELFAIKWDTRRQLYYRDMLTEALKAIHYDNINLRGTFAWSILDNFEWASGLGSKFGITYVNQSDPELARTPKLSAFQLRDFGKQHLQS